MINKCIAPELKFACHDVRLLFLFFFFFFWRGGGGGAPLSFSAIFIKGTNLCLPDFVPG